jgi:hypothetical protein
MCANGARGRGCVGERTRWLQRIRATLFHHGISGNPEQLRSGAGRAFPAFVLDGHQIARMVITG